MYYDVIQALTHPQEEITMTETKTTRSPQTTFDLRGLRKCTKTPQVASALNEAGVPEDFESRLLALQMVSPSVPPFACTLSPEPLDAEELFYIAAHRLVSDNNRRIG